MYQVLAVRSPVCLLPLVEVFDLSPPVVIPLYYIEFDISIGKGNNIAFDILSVLYIAFNRQTCYNIAILGGVADINRPPTGRRSNKWPSQRHSKKR